MQEKKTTLSKKIKSYSALAGSIVAIGSTADAQVVYTNVTPDSVVNTVGGFYNLDLNADGIIDFKILTNHGSSSTSGAIYDYVAITPNDSINAIDTVAGGYADALNAGIGLCPTSLWSDTTGGNAAIGLLGFNLTAPFAFTAGNFIGATGKFVGLRFQKLGINYNGWVRLNVATDCKSFTVIDYAYRNNAAACSITGLTSDVGISESALFNLVNVFAADKNINVQLDQTLPVGGFISVTNVLGQEVTKVNITNASTVISMANEKTGIYIVTVTQSTGAYTKKVSVQ
jgi:hypothetical protein